MSDGANLVKQLETAIVNLANASTPQLDLVTLNHTNDSGDQVNIEYQRRTDDCNIVTVAFEDDTVYELALSDQAYDSLKSALETCEDFQDVIVDTVIGDTDEEPVMPPED